MSMFDLNEAVPQRGHPAQLLLAIISPIQWRKEAVAIDGDSVLFVGHWQRPIVHYVFCSPAAANVVAGRRVFHVNSVSQNHWLIMGLPHRRRSERNVSIVHNETRGHRRRWRHLLGDRGGDGNRLSRCGSRGTLRPVHSLPRPGESLARPEMS
jgi:hypothetical protein